MEEVELTRIQVFVQDPVGPLIRVLKATKDDSDNHGVTMEEARSTIVDAIGLLGNAPVQISRVCRRKLKS